MQLDRGLATTSFLDLFKDVKVWHVQTTVSDHCCLVIEHYRKDRGQERRQKHFRYENMWRRDPSYLGMVRGACEALGEASDLRNCRLGWAECKELCKSGTDLLLGRFAKSDQSRSAGASRAEKSLMSKISELLSREEIMEKQRSRMDWLKDGDRITALRREDGELVTEQAELENISKAFCTNLFTAQEVLELDEVLQHEPVKVTDDMNVAMNQPFTKKEVEQALFMMGRVKLQDRMVLMRVSISTTGIFWARVLQEWCLIS